MTTAELICKARRVLSRLLGRYVFQYPRILKYRILSDCRLVEGTPVVYQPVLLSGKGKIVFGKNSRLGVARSPFFYTGYGYIEARTEDAVIEIGDNVWLNNNFVFVSAGGGISIGSNVLMGSNVEISDSDFHSLDPSKRDGRKPTSKKVIIEDNVFIGSNVKILKGITIGRNSVIANSSVVSRSIPENTVAGGIPTKILKNL